MINRSAEIMNFRNDLRAHQKPLKGRITHPPSTLEKWYLVADKGNYDYSGVSVEDLGKMLDYARVQCDIYTGHYYEFARWRTGYESIKAEMAARG